MAIKEMKPWRQTPLTETSNLSKAAGCRIFLKHDYLQPGGSFKSRGIGNYIVCALKRAENPESVHFYSSSGGNAGLAAVMASKFVGRPCSVVVPLATKPMMIAKIRAAGATDVVQFGASWKEADTYMREVVMKNAEARGETAVPVMPFDHPDIWDGHSSLIKELRQQFNDMGESPPDIIACSVGGGGLFNGIIEGMEAQGQEWDKTMVVAVETEGAASLGRSLEAGEHITLPGITSQATTLGAIRVCDRTYELATKGVASGKVKNAIFSDAEAAMGCWRLADDERALVELSCGVTVALCYGGRLKRALGRPVRPDEKVVIILCGGEAVTTSMVEGWRQEFGDLDSNGVAPTLDDVPSAHTAPNGS